MKERLGVALLVLGVLFALGYGVTRLGSVSVMSADPSQRAVVLVGEGPPSWLLCGAGGFLLTGIVLVVIGRRERWTAFDGS